MFVYIYIYIYICVCVCVCVCVCIRSTCEGGNSKLLQQNFKKCHKKGYPERKRKEMVTSMGGNNERGDY
jgi:hypothetical protein